MDANQEENVDETYIVTQMIHPNYFVLFDPQKRDDLNRKALEDDLESQIQLYNQFERNISYKKGDMVAFYWTEGGRFIRCEIDDVKQFNNLTYFFMFAIDYGVSIFTTCANELYSISEVIKFSPTPIIDKVSLSVLPAETRIDYMENKKELVFCSTWCPLALKKFRQCIDSAALIKFKPSTSLPSYRGFIFGDLEITTFYGLVFSLCDALVNAKVAMNARTTLEFQKKFDKVHAREIERWNDNNKHGGILNTTEDGKFPLFYDDEIYTKKYVVNCESVKLKFASIQKVMQWQEKNQMLNVISPSSEIDEETDIEKCESVLNCNDEGFDENIKPKNKPIFLTFGKATT